MDTENRVVVLIDMDCFYCQVEEKLNPELAGKPIAVVQYNPWKGGGIIAVNYVARAMGVTRHMRGDEAKDKCPEIQLPSVPCLRGKADITKYRDAGKDVAKVLQRYTSLLERASIDEAYLDITAPVQERLRGTNVNTIITDHLPSTHALGYDSVEEFITDVHNCGSESIDFDYEHAKRLLVGAIIVSEIRAAVLEETGYTCSAGIAQNKILAKLVCGMNKPNKQTILPKHSIDILYKTLPLKKVKHLGGKFGDSVCEVLKITKMAELQTFSEKELQNKFDEKNGTWLYNIARGVDSEPVQARFNPKSIGCCKQLRGKAALTTLESLRKWLKDLGDEIEDRLEKDALENNRTPKQMVVSYSTLVADGRDMSSSRSYNFSADDELCGDLFSSKALELLIESSEGAKLQNEESNRKLKSPITFLGISVGKFEDHSDTKKIKKIKDYFAAGPSKEKPKAVDKPNENKPKDIAAKDHGKEYILKKFFQVTEKNKENVDTAEKVDNNVEFTLDKQESFFAKLLSKKIDNDAKSIESDSSVISSRHNMANKSPPKPNTPICEVVNCGDNSNDTEYSGSTINNEINTSIALFEEDPAAVDRISDIRKLLSKSTILNNIEKKSDDMPLESIQQNVNAETEMVKCSECGKDITVDMVEMHADYHFALNLRNEEREQTRSEIKEKKPAINEDKKKRKPVAENSKTENMISITNFFVKVPNNQLMETCPECGKKVPLDKLTEHSDFHEAQKLSRELNKRPHSSVPPASSSKRKRSTSPVKKQKVPKCKSIESFFKT